MTPAPEGPLPEGFRRTVGYLIGALAVLCFVSASLPAVARDPSREQQAVLVALGLLVVWAVWSLSPKARWARHWKGHVGATVAVYLFVGYLEAGVIGAAHNPWWRLLVSFLWGFMPFLLLP